MDAIQVLQKRYEVVRVEDIRNHSLLKAFQTLTADLNKEPQWGFHGTNSANIPSIVAKGLLVPGRGSVSVENGNYLGTGIYLTKPDYYAISVGYAYSKDPVYVKHQLTRLVLCQVLPGEGVADHKECYVAKESKYVLPCYTVDLVPRGNFFHLQEGRRGPVAEYSDYRWGDLRPCRVHQVFRDK